MKTNVLLSRRPLLCVYYAFLIVIAVLWALPKGARAQLLVTNTPAGAGVGTGVVSEYDATTGHLIKAKFITGLTSPSGLAVSGDKLFVSNDVGFVGKYDADTGAVINPSFIKSGFDDPEAVALTDNILYVAYLGDGTGGFVYNYNASTGEINHNDIFGLVLPGGLALSGTKLFVSDFANGTVGVYLAATGHTIKAKLIKGLVGPIGLAVDGNNLFVAVSSGSIGKYNATTGAPIKSDFITGLSDPNGLALIDNKLYVANYTSGVVGEYDATTGAAINPNFITGLTNPRAIVVKRKK